MNKDYEGYQDITIKVKTNTYKELQNYMRNEVKINAETVKSTLQDMLKGAVEKVNVQETIDKYLEEWTIALLNKYIKAKEDINEIINAKINKIIVEYVAKNFNDIVKVAKEGEKEI